MTKIKFDSGIKYYEAMGWCMTNVKMKQWKPDPLTHIIYFTHSKDALIVAMKFT